MDIFRFFDNNFLNAISIIFLFVICLFIILFLIAKVIDWVPVIKNIVTKIISHFYLILIPFPIIYLIYYNANIYDGKLLTSFPIKDEVAEILSQLSIWFFTVGIFSGTLKYLNTITYVKNKFKEIILSEEFDDKLTSKLEVFAYSDESLEKYDKIEELWERVTLLKYKTNFPLIYDKLKKKVNNELFSKETTPFYYRNFCLDINIKLEENNLVIDKKTRYTLIRPNTDSFKWSFKTEVIKSETEETEAHLKLYLNDDDSFIEFNKSNSKIEHIGDRTIITFEEEFKDNIEYDIVTERKSIQNIDDDRFIGFGTNRIIDYLEVNINCCDKLKYVFNDLNKYRFKKIEQFNGGTKFVYSNIITPNDIFKIFFIRKE